MPLTPFQAQLFKIIAANRNPDSFLDRHGQPARGEVFNPSWTPHFGSIGGAWPKIIEA